MCFACTECMCFVCMYTKHKCACKIYIYDIIYLYHTCTYVPSHVRVCLSVCVLHTHTHTLCTHIFTYVCMMYKKSPGRIGVRVQGLHSRTTSCDAAMLLVNLKGTGTMLT